MSLEIQKQLVNQLMPGDQTRMAAGQLVVDADDLREQLSIHTSGRHRAASVCRSQCTNDWLISIRKLYSGSIGVLLVFDFADEFFKDVFQRNDAHSSVILPNDCQMSVPTAESH
jgi:hypothetical protein